MKNTLKYLSLLMTILMFSGCEDRTDYLHSKYKQINIAKLQNIQGNGYRLNGTGYDTHQTFYLFFCKNNKYAYTIGSINARIYRGEYRVDLANDQIIMTGDDVDSQGKKLYGTVKTKSGYFEQEKKYLIKGTIQEGFIDLHKINDSFCDVKKETYSF